MGNISDNKYKTRVLQTHLKSDPFLQHLRRFRISFLQLYPIIFQIPSFTPEYVVIKLTRFPFKEMPAFPPSNFGIKPISNVRSWFT